MRSALSDARKALTLLRCSAGLLVIVVLLVAIAGTRGVDLRWRNRSSDAQTPPPTIQQPPPSAATPAPAVAAAASAAASANPHPPNYLSTAGSKIVDPTGREVRLTGVNWFGLETGTYSPHGLWARNWQEILDQIAALGYNTIRLPYSSRVFDPNARPMEG